MSESIDDRTRRVVSEVFGVPLDQVTADTSYETIDEWDSLNTLNLLIAVESEFGVSIAPEDATEFVSVARIVNLLKNKGAA